MKDRMKDRLKHTLQGIAIGVALAMVIGFSWLGWTLDSTAKRMAQDQANSAVVAALSPIWQRPDAASRAPAAGATGSGSPV